MNTVITTFYNEEYMLPWWINHHKKLFDHGIMINSNSTDRSLEICKELCPPHWKIVNSIDSGFSADGIDHEVKCYENMVDGFKMTLTSTEFLFPSVPLSVINDYMDFKKINYIKTTGVCMVDMFPNDLPRYDRPLIEQKHHGMITGYTDPTHRMEENTYDHFYGRFYHNDSYGKYALGRHWITDQKSFVVNNLFTLKYKYSPWNDCTVKRIQQFLPKMASVDLNRGLCLPHMQTEYQHQYVYNHFLSTAHDLRENILFFNAYNYCMGL